MLYYSLTWDSWALADVHLSKRRPGSPGHPVDDIIIPYVHECTRAGDPCVFVVV